MICERWIGSTNPKGRTRKSTGISVPKQHILKDGKVSEKAQNVDEIRKSIDSVISRIRKVYEEFIRNRTYYEDVLHKSKIEAVVNARDDFDVDDMTFVTRSSPKRRAKGVVYGGFVRRFMSEYVMANGKTYIEGTSAMGNAKSMAYNMNLFSLHYYDGKLTVQDFADPEQAPMLAAKMIRFFTEESDEPMVDESLDSHLKRLRTALSWAQKKGLVRNLDLTPYYFNEARQPKFTLPVSEFLQVANYSFEEGEARLECARDSWVFLCLTALRYKDSQLLPQLSPDMGTFSVTTSKTGKSVTIPVLDMTADLIRKYPNGLPKISNQKLNKYIKEALELIGLTRNVKIMIVRGGVEKDVDARLCDVVTTHTGRRQFVTVARTLGVPDALICQVTGHSNLNEIDTYTHVPRETILHQLTRMNHAFGRLSV